MNEKELIKKLKELPIEPGMDWQRINLDSYKQLTQRNVPEDDKLRNRFIVNFFTLFNMKTKVIAGVGVALVAFLLLGSGVYASNASVPGDILYSVDKGIEGIRRALISDPEKQAEYEMNVLDERMDEFDKLEEREASQERLNVCLQEMEQQQERVRERVQVMEEKHENGEVEDAVQERVMERYENQTEEHKEIQEKNQNKNDSQSTDLNITQQTETEDTPGELGGVGVQMRPQDQDRDGSTGDNGSNEGDGDKPREGWE